ncbi:MAG: methyltransferase [Acidimicrobiia bacterium]|nr:methyltransferase [Acidimicrobiia bacterium]
MSELQTVSVIDPTGGDPFTITGSTTDFGVVGAIARNGGYYEPHVLRALGRVLTPESVCLDIGANIGVLSVFLSRHCPQGAVHSFEPALDNLDNLARNLELNHTTNVSTHRIALYDSVGSAELNFTADHPGGSFISATDTRGGSPETVTISTLDAWVQENDLQRLDLIKLDVEGGELRVLRGGQATLARFKPKLIVECNPIPLRRFQQATEIDLLRLLQQFYGTDI